MRSLMLINDPHGYIRPDETFSPGYAHKRVNGELMRVEDSMFELPASAAKRLLTERKACYVYAQD